VENLKVTMYNDGTAIPLNNTYTSGTVSTVWQGLTTGAYTIYGNESSTGANATNYGFLYNWYAAVGIITPMGSPTKNICPTGWHVPTDAEWTSLIQFMVPSETVSATVIGTQSTTAGTLMKSSTLWNTVTPPSPGTDNFGFTALPGGYRNFDGGFGRIRASALFWSATEFDVNYAWNRSLDYNRSGVFRNNSREKSVGFSVRCLRD
jgi:uncharacterized protein (TIGR02145 family)